MKIVAYLNREQHHLLKKFLEDPVNWVKLTILGENGKPEERLFPITRQNRPKSEKVISPFASKPGMTLTEVEIVVPPFLPGIMPAKNAPGSNYLNLHYITKTLDHFSEIDFSSIRENCPGVEGRWVAVSPNDFFFDRFFKAIKLFPTAKSDPS